VGEGDKVFSRFTWHGTHRGEFFGVPATGRQITVKGTVVDRVVAGEMVESRIQIDGMSMMRQLGVKRSPAGREVARWCLISRDPRSFGGIRNAIDVFTLASLDSTSLRPNPTNPTNTSKPTRN
jgi:SnoaL-like polyketide cyclase